MSPDGASLYAPNANDDNVSQYDVGIGGLLAPKTPATAPTGSAPFGVAVGPPPGTINVVKDAVPDDAQDFSFTAGGGLTPSTFSLDDDANGMLSNTQTFTGVGPGSGYSISETVPSGWDQTAATCDDGSPVTNIDVSTGETVTCTFTNNKIFGYARPKAATPIEHQARACLRGVHVRNATHGAPLNVPSCSPPAQSSDYLTLGTPDANGKPRLGWEPHAEGRGREPDRPRQRRPGRCRDHSEPHRCA